MFVDDVEFRNYPKIIEAGVFLQIRSIVRLQHLDIFKCLRGKQGLNRPVGFSEVTPANTDGEIGISATGNPVAIQNGQLANEVIQGRTKIVDNIPDNKRPCGIIRSNFAMLDNHTLPLRMVIDNERAAFFFRGTPLRNGGDQLREVVLRTLNFLPGSNGRCAHVAQM
jgi:hypothetical protein